MTKSTFFILKKHIMAAYVEPFSNNDSKCGQGRIQGRRQPAPGHPLGSLKNKGRMIKNKFFFTRIFYLFEPGTPYQSFLTPPLNVDIHNLQLSLSFLINKEYEQAKKFGAIFERCQTGQP
jgi:hypothetical protein